MNKNAEKEIIEGAKKILTDYLASQNLRKTKQRFDILEVIYTKTTHFTVDDLDFLMRKENYKISRATLYNTIDLLEKLDLITRHKFNSKISFYEKSYKQKKHNHLICTECGKIIEFCHPRLYDVEQDIGEFYNFQINDSEIILYGICEECQKKKT